MESKYYVPEIEEFHVGFEYEYFNKLSNEWGKAYVTEIAFLEHREYYSKRDEYMKLHFRVKYLDKEDIESLKFMVKDEYKYLSTYLYRGFLKPDFNKGIELVYYSDFHRIVIQSDEDHFNHGERVYFDGKIKNKSELSILLKQLNIL